MRRRCLPAALAAMLPLAAATQDRCIEEYNAAEARIYREFARTAGGGTDQAAARAASRKMHDDLKAASRKAEDCQRAGRPPLSPSAIAARDDCIAASNRKGQEVARRYGGRSLTFEEQKARRAEEERLLDERMACAPPARR